MPSLNVATYIEECLLSVLQQSFQDLEILVVDAGSTDGTLEIVESYCEKDARLRLIHSPKKSYGYQMNLGIQEAKSEYIGIVETDDTIHPKMYEDLYETMLKNDCDYVKCNHTEVVTLLTGEIFHSKGGRNLIDSCEYGEVFSPSQNLDMLLRDYYVWQGIYKKDFLVKNHIRFHESSGAAYQDNGFLFQVGIKGKGAVYLEKAYYYYRKDNNNSSMYQVKAFSYIVQEYQYIRQVMEQELQDNSQLAVVYYTRMFQQTLYRLLVLSMFQRDYEQVEGEIEQIRMQLECAVEQGDLTEWDLPVHQWRELQEFISNPRLLSQSFDLQYEVKRKQMKELVEHAKKKEQVVIFGSGRWGRFCRAILEKSGVTTVRAFCDNNTTLLGTEVEGIPVISVEQATNERVSSTYIIANQKYVREMYEQLQEQGVWKQDIKNYSFGCNIDLFYLLP